MAALATASGGPSLGVGAAVLLAAGFLLAYYGTIGKLTEYWASNDMYSYGFLVPFISGYLIWLRRDVLSQVSPAPSFGLGLPLLAFGVSMLVVGIVSSTNLLQELSLPVSLAGTVLLVLGRRMTQALLFPLAYLLTMVPFWDLLTNRLHLPFQLYSAAIGVTALRWLDVPVFRDGIYIHLPNITLEVADLCSGVNHLVAVLCIGVPITHLFVKRWPVRVFIITTAIVIALLSNGLRVGMVSLFAYYELRGPNGDIHGPFALFRSLIISAVGFVVLFWLISRFADAKPHRVRVAPEANARHRDSRPPFAAAVAMAIALLAGSVAFTRWHATTPVSLPGSLVAFPTTIGRWTLESERPVSPAVQSVGFDQSISRGYAAADGSRLDLLLGYFERQEQGRELVGYKVSRLISEGVSLSRARSGADVRVSDFLTTVKGVTYHVTYWYVLDGHVTPRGYEAKWWTTWNSLTAGRSNGGIVVIRTRLDGAQSIDVGRARVRDFIDGVMLAAGSYFPRRT